MSRFKRYGALLTAIIVLCCSGCESSENSQSAASKSGDDISDNEQDYAIDDEGFSRFDVDDNIQPVSYADKTKLVYLTNYDTQFTTTDDDPRIYDEVYIENAVNEYLDKIGCDYYVDFVNNGEFDFKTGEVYPNLDKYEAMLKDGEQVDIVNTGQGLATLGGYGDTYHIFVDKGYLAPLNDYFETDSGKKFYAQFDEIVWRQTTCADGIIYGKPTDYALARPLVLSFDDDICGEIGLDKNAVNDLGDLATYLKKYADNGKAGLLLDSTNELYYEMAGFCKFKGVYVNVDTQKAENIFENESAIEYLKQIEDFKNGGYIVNSADQAEYFCSLSPAMPYLYDSTEVAAKGYLQLEELNGIVGISSASEHKDKAFEFLALLNTDKALADIIYNGTEGRNYVADNGVKCLNKNALPFYENYDSMTNTIIADSNSQSDDKKAESMKACWENSQVSPFYGLQISDELSEKLDKIAAINDEFYPLFYGDYGDYSNLDEALSAANKKLSEAGIDDVLDELNGQYSANKK